MFKRFKVLMLIVVLVTVSLPSGVTAQDGETAYWPTESWRTSTPEEQGMDSVALAELIEAIPQRGAIDSLMIVRNGYVVAEVYWHPFQRGLTREQMSASKSVLSALVGIAIDRDYIESIDQKVLEFFPEIDVENLDDNKKAMTIRDLLTMTSGFDCEMANGTDPIVELGFRPDATQFGLSWPMADEPGKTWRYCNINAYLLSAIVTRTTGMDTLAFAQQVLFAPLGISDVDWNVSAEGVPVGAGGLQLNTVDMTKIGYLFLNNGRWGDTQVVPADWVRDSVQNYAPQHPWAIGVVDYGYLWWLYETPVGAFYEASGMFFQHIHIAPDMQLVVADTGTDNEYYLANLFWPTVMITVMQAVKSDGPLPPNPEGVARLEAAVRAAAKPEAQPVAALPARAAEVSGKTYHLTMTDLLLADLDRVNLAEDDWYMATFGLDFMGEEATLRLQTLSGIELNIPVGLDGICRTTPSHMGTLAAQGHWEGETRFVLYLHRLEQGPVLKYTLDFANDAFTGMVESARPGDAGFVPGSLEGQLTP